MSSTGVAVRAFKNLKPQDFRVLIMIELEMSKHKYVPEKDISRLLGLKKKQTEYLLKTLHKFGLINRWIGSYVGYYLKEAGYDCLAMNALVKANVLEAFGKSIGVGKESDVYDALAPSKVHTLIGERVVVKFHRLGHISFRQTRRSRGYIAERRHISWLYQSRLAAEKEFEALKQVHSFGISVPKPIRQNRHVVVMGMIDGADLYNFHEIPHAENVLDEILGNLRKTYLEAGIIHADLSEYNVILKPDGHITIIDWPQYVNKDHPNAEKLLRRDIRNILRFFQRKFDINRSLQKTIDFIKIP
jgi:RIO kinase 2